MASHEQTRRRFGRIRRRTLLDSTDGISDYYANPWLMRDRTESIRSLLGERLRTQLLDAAQAAEPDKSEHLPSAVLRFFVPGLLLVSTVAVAIAFVVASNALAQVERAYSEQTVQFFSTETRILEQLRWETAEEIGRRDAEIARYLALLREMEDRREQLERQFASDVERERERLDSLRQSEVAREEERLAGLGLSQDSVSGPLYRFVLETERRYTAKLETFVAERNRRFGDEQRTLSAEQESAEAQLAAATEERNELSVVYRSLAEEIRHAAAERDPAHGATIGATGGSEATTLPETVALPETALRTLRRAEGRAVLDAALHSRMLDHIDAANAAFAAGDSARARSEVEAAVSLFDRAGENFGLGTRDDEVRFVAAAVQTIRQLVRWADPEPSYDELRPDPALEPALAERKNDAPDVPDFPDAPDVALGQREPRLLRRGALAGIVTKWRDDLAVVERIGGAPAAMHDPVYFFPGGASDLTASDSSPVAAPVTDGGPTAGTPIAEGWVTEVSPGYLTVRVEETAIATGEPRLFDLVYLRSSD